MCERIICFCLARDLLSRVSHRLKNWTETHIAEKYGLKLDEMQAWCFNARAHCYSVCILQDNIIATAKKTLIPLVLSSLEVGRLQICKQLINTFQGCGGRRRHHYHFFVIHDGVADGQ